MQNNTKKASILIWAIFLSFMVSVIFIWVSTRINKNIKNNKNLNNQMNIKNEIKNLASSWVISWNYNNRIFENWDELVWDSNTGVFLSFKKSEIKYFRFPYLTDFNINLLSSWAVFYDINGSLNWSWVIDSYKDITSFSWVLKIKNLWWYVNLDLTANNSFVSKYFYYKIIKKIWNKEVIKQRWNVEDF